MPIRPENKSRYPKDWPQIAERIKTQRAGGRCECEGECGSGKHLGRCEARHMKRHPVTKAFVFLTVAHLDHTPENCAENNLKAMCQLCHNRYDADHRKQTRAQTRAEQAVADAAWMTPLFTPDG
jgi:hypothetical protein